MSDPDNAGNGFDPVADIGDQRPKISPARTGTDNQGSFPPDTASGETERLLDIDGLLKMVRLISVMKEGERLGDIDKGS